jgi:hypothetical protein
MKVWNLSYHAADIGTMQEWYGSKAAALKRRAELRRASDDPDDLEPIAVSQLSIPTNKAGLLAWLNKHVDTENG